MSKVIRYEKKIKITRYCKFILQIEFLSKFDSTGSSIVFEANSSVADKRKANDIFFISLVDYYF